MDWLDRDSELARLERLGAHTNCGLAVVWGRRRVGKTRLLLEWARRAGGTYFVADETAPHVWRRRIAETWEPVLLGV